jgi:hypothetical protein
MSTETSPWDISFALSDLSIDIARHVNAGTQPDEAELRRWSEWIVNSAQVYGNLRHACEDVIELGTSDARLESLKQAMTFAQGQFKYWPREDRW